MPESGARAKAWESGAGFAAWATGAETTVGGTTCTGDFTSAAAKGPGATTVVNEACAGCFAMTGEAFAAAGGWTKSVKSDALPAAGGADITLTLGIVELAFAFCFATGLEVLVTVILSLGGMTGILCVGDTSGYTGADSGSGTSIWWSADLARKLVAREKRFKASRQIIFVAV